METKKESIDLMRLLGHMVEQFFDHFEYKAEFIIVMKKEGDKLDRFGMASNFKNRLEVPLTLATLLQRLMEMDKSQGLENLFDNFKGDDTTH